MQPSAAGRQRLLFRFRMEADLSWETTTAGLSTLLYEGKPGKVSRLVCRVLLLCGGILTTCADVTQHHYEIRTDKCAAVNTFAGSECSACF